MKISVLGAGNLGCAVTADLTLKGHDCLLFKTSNRLHNENFAYVKQTKRVTLRENGASKTARIRVAESYEEAVTGADVIIIDIQTNFHERVINKAAKYLKDGQIILLEPGYLSTCYILKACDKDITVVEAESSPIDCRITEPGHITVYFRNVRNPVGVYPRDRARETLRALEPLGYNFHLLDSVIESALHNPNLIIHTVGAIFSIPRIEHTNGDYSMYREVFTPHIWNIADGLDAEKMNVLERLGCERTPYLDACKFRNSPDLSRSAKEVFTNYANNLSPRGPHIPDSRFITEDVPEGLVLLESFGKAFDIPTPVCTGLVNIASAALNRDFRAEGRTIERLGGMEMIKRCAPVG